MTRSICGLFGWGFTYLTAFGLISVIGELPRFIQETWLFFILSMTFNIGFWYVGLSNHFYFLGETSEEFDDENLEDEWFREDRKLKRRKD